jgi:hypothetical protein
MANLNPELKRRLSSWRNVAGVVEHSPDSLGDISINEAEVRQRQRRFASMCLNMVKIHDAFVADLKAYIGQGDRDAHHQHRVEE